MSFCPRFGIGGTPVPAGPPPPHVRRIALARGPDGRAGPSRPVWIPTSVRSPPTLSEMGAPEMLSMNTSSHCPLYARSHTLLTW